MKDAEYKINPEGCRIMFACEADDWKEITNRRPNNPMRTIEDIFHLIRIFPDWKLKAIYDSIVISDDPKYEESETLFYKLSQQVSQFYVDKKHHSYAYGIIVDLKFKTVSVGAHIDTDLMRTVSYNTFEEIRNDRNVLGQVLYQFDKHHKPIDSIL